MTVISVKTSITKLNETEHTITEKEPLGTNEKITAISLKNHIIKQNETEHIITEKELFGTNENDCIIHSKIALLIFFVCLYIILANSNLF